MRSVFVVMVMAVGCGGDDVSPDAAVAVDAPVDTAIDGAPADLTCEEIAARLQELAPTVSTACEVASDCAPVGYPQRDDGAWTCNCGYSWQHSSCGLSVNEQAWLSHPEITALLTEWYGRCLTGIPTGSCDCGPGETTCQNQLCRTADRNCLPG